MKNEKRGGGNIDISSPHFAVLTFDLYLLFCKDNSFLISYPEACNVLLILVFVTHLTPSSCDLGTKFISPEGFSFCYTNCYASISWPLTLIQKIDWWGDEEGPLSSIIDETTSRSSTSLPPIARRKVSDKLLTIEHKLLCWLLNLLFGCWWCVSNVRFLISSVRWLASIH